MSLYIAPRYEKISRKFCYWRTKYKARKLNSNKFTIISNTCIGGVIYHSLGREIISPTINLYIRPKEFIIFCKNLRKYLEKPLEECTYNPQIGYPVVTIGGDVTLYCKHYNDFQEVQEAWRRRIERIDWENICFIMTDRDFIPPFDIKNEAEFCGEDVLKSFDKLPYRNKVCFVKNREFTYKYSSCVQITKCCGKKCVGVITELVTITGKRMYECAKKWDYISFLNEMNGTKKHI